MFQKATKAKSKLRAALFGPSGAGKTYTALAMASGMGKKIALIDSERGTASKYADRFDFDVVDLSVFTVDEYCNNIDEAARAGYEILIIDSLTHSWEKLCDDVQIIADARYKGNYWAAWSEGTPMQKKLINSLVSFPGHIIVTMRSKTEWQTGGEGSKTRPIRVGLSPEQGKGIEYEFDILLEITTEHIATVIKDRTGKFQDRIMEKPGKAFGEELVAWLNDGADVQPPPKPLNVQLKEQIVSILTAKTPDLTDFFTDEDRQNAKGQINETKGDVEKLKIVLSVWQDELENRKASYVSIPFNDAPAASQPSQTAVTPQAQQPKVKPEKQQSLREEYRQILHDKKVAEMQAAGVKQEATSMTEAEAETEDDGFEDDVPWRNGKSKAAEAAAGGGQMDIF